MAEKAEGNLASCESLRFTIDIAAGLADIRREKGNGFRCGSTQEAK